MKKVVTIAATVVLAISSLAGCAKTNEASSLKDELAAIEAKSMEYENMDWDVPQQEANQLTYDWYMLWDDELNSIWGRLKDKVSDKYKDTLLEGQRDWISWRDANMKEDGLQALGGSLQAQLENSTAEYITRARVYYLASCLAEAEGDPLELPSEIEDLIYDAQPDVGYVLQKFQGQHIFDESRGACVGVEKSADCDYGIEDSEWTIWVTGGDILTDLDVLTYTRNSVIFHKTNGGFESYYKLGFNMEGSVTLYYGHALDEWEDEVVCD